MTTLIVDDDINIKAKLQRFIPGETRWSSNLAEGLIEAGNWLPSTILLDVYFRWSLQTGIDMLPMFKKASPKSHIIIITSCFVPELEWVSLRNGAFAFHEKGDGEALRVAVSRAHEITSTLGRVLSFHPPAPGLVH